MGFSDGPIEPGDERGERRQQPDDLGLDGGGSRQGPGIGGAPPG